MSGRTADALSDLSLALTGETRPATARRPWIGILGVLLGAMISTLDGRITQFGLADIRGAVHAGFDEGSWIVPAFTVGQMMMAPLAVWSGAAFGTRRVLLVAVPAFAISNLLLPLSGNLYGVLVFQALSGLASGTFVPLTTAFIIRNLPRRLVIYGIAAYAMNLELSTNISASIEGWFVDNWSWSWIFWDTAALAPAMLACVYFGMPAEPAKRAFLRRVDWAGLVFPSVGFSLFYAALSQGDRLDWLASGTIDGLLIGGGLLLAAFVAFELLHDRPWLELRVAVSGNMPFLIFHIMFFRFIVLSTGYIIPQFLATVQGYRALETGDVLLWIALPQFLLAPALATLLRYADPRYTLVLGIGLVGCACFMAAQLTQVWASGDFLPSQIIQAVGQSLALTSLVAYSVGNVQPSQATTFGAILQTMRLFGSALGSAFMQTYIRVREQIHSSFLGEHVAAGSHLVVERLRHFSAFVAPHGAPGDPAVERAVALLAGETRVQAFVLAYADGFAAIGVAVLGALVLLMFLRPLPKRAAAREAGARD
jgi:MFS transporter, DHA2 family, multidrug resistance protein